MAMDVLEATAANSRLVLEADSLNHCNLQIEMSFNYWDISSLKTDLIWL
jgi:hypothetical protein